MIKKLFWILILVPIFWISCEKPEDYPNEPQIKFIDFRLSDTTLVFNVIDGDGNVGLKDNENILLINGYDTVVYDKNLFITIFEKKNGIFEEIPLADESSFHYRLPYMEPNGQNKTLKADVEVRFTSSFKFKDLDTVKFEFYIIDRQLKESNIEETPEVLLKKKEEE